MIVRCIAKNHYKGHKRSVCQLRRIDRRGCALCQTNNRCKMLCATFSGIKSDEFMDLSDPTALVVRHHGEPSTPQLGSETFNHDLAKLTVVSIAHSKCFEPSSLYSTVLWGPR